MCKKVKEDLREDTFNNALSVISMMTILEHVNSMEEYREVVVEYEKRVRIWRGSILARLVSERCMCSDE